MKNIISLFVLVLAAMSLNAQPKSLEYKEEKNDYFLNILWNPDLSLGELIEIGQLDSENTELREFYAYSGIVTIKKKCEELGLNMLESYNKVKATWPVFQELSKIKSKIYWHYNAFRNDIFVPRLTKKEIHQVSIVPLKLEEY